MIAAKQKKIRLNNDDRKRQLLRAAIECFAQKGFGGTKTRDIAAAAGVSEAILFRHFASKEDLYHAILEVKETTGHGLKRLRELEEHAARRDDRALLEALAAITVRSYRDDPALHRLQLYARLEGHPLASLFSERFGLPLEGFLRNYILLRQREGAFRRCDPRTAINFIRGSIVHYAMTRYLFRTKGQTREETPVEDMVMLVMRGLEARPS